MLKTQLFSERLKMLREERNMSVKELGETVGTSGATISRYETGVHEPKSRMVQKLADYFKVNPSWLMGADVDKYSNEDVLYYDDPRIFNHLSDKLKDFVIKEENTPYLVLAEKYLSKLSDKELQFVVKWLETAIEENNNK